jgi:hypothetical protein
MGAISAAAMATMVVSATPAATNRARGAGLTRSELLAFSSNSGRPRRSSIVLERLGDT